MSLNHLNLCWPLLLLPSTPWTDCSLPGSPVPGILQARVLEWGAISFSMIISRFIYVTSNGIVSSLLWLSNVPFYKCTTFKIGKICKQCNQQGTDLQNMQTAHTTQYQKKQLSPFFSWWVWLKVCQFWQCWLSFGRTSFYFHWSFLLISSFFFSCISALIFLISFLLWDCLFLFL